MVQNGHSLLVWKKDDWNREQTKPTLADQAFSLVLWLILLQKSLQIYKINIKKAYLGKKYIIANNFLID